MISKIKRKNLLLRFGYGVDAMKNVTVCKNCSSLENSERMFCQKCGSRLPMENLYDLYESRHKKCSGCGCVLSDSMHYCPKCGELVTDSKVV